MVWWERKPYQGSMHTSDLYYLFHGKFDRAFLLCVELMFEIHQVLCKSRVLANRSRDPKWFANIRVVHDQAAS